MVKQTKSNQNRPSEKESPLGVDRPSSSQRISKKKKASSNSQKQKPAQTKTNSKKSSQKSSQKKKPSSFIFPYALCKDTIKAISDQIFNVHVTGLESVPQKGGCLVVCNHLSVLDPFIQALYSSRKLTFLGKAEIFELTQELKKNILSKGSILHLQPFQMMLPYLEKFLEIISDTYVNQLMEWGGYPIIRNYATSGNVKDAARYYRELEDGLVKILHDGHLLAIYPEGTRSTTGVMGPFKTMAAKLAIRAKVPIIPTGLSGTWKIFSSENITKNFLRNKITYNIGKPIMPEDFVVGEHEKKIAKILTTKLEKQVFALTQHSDQRSKGRGVTRVL